MQNKKIGLSNNVLKIIALVSMTIDHVGFMLFPQVEFLRIIGRLAMPIFAYMIAEGCFYTKNKLKHFLLIFILGVLSQIVFFISNKSLEMSILIVFSISIGLIYLYQLALDTKKWYYFALLIIAIGVSAWLNYGLPKLITKYRFSFDYGFFAMILPLLVYMFKEKWQKLIALAVGLFPIAFFTPWLIQWFSYLALPILAFYNGEKGKLNIKYLFYVYYPLHLVVLYGISLIV